MEISRSGPLETFSCGGNFPGFLPNGEKVSRSGLLGNTSLRRKLSRENPPVERGFGLFDRKYKGTRLLAKAELKSFPKWPLGRILLAEETFRAPAGFPRILPEVAPWEPFLAEETFPVIDRSVQ